MTGIEQRTRRASVADTLRFGARVGAPFVAAGAIARRKPVMGLLERRQSNAAVPVEVTRLRQRYGSAPLAMKAGPRTLAVVLSP
ncbi:cytochrome P450, partial [Rhodococcus sp. HNM0569]|nr:cytochrome P450 [Rhodococcus sp. HNM0569]